MPAADTGNATRAETRAGAGPIVLSGANTYTGGTVVSSGTLVADNPAGSATGPGEVRVRPGATLTDNGSVGGETSIDGTADGGGLVTMADGTLTAGGGLVNHGTVFSAVGRPARRSPPWTRRPGA